MKYLVLLIASLACASAQVFSVESGLYTPEWIREQAFDDLDVYYEEAFQDDFDPEGGDDVGEVDTPTDVDGISEPPGTDVKGIPEIARLPVTPRCRFVGSESLSIRHPTCINKAIWRCVKIFHKTFKYCLLNPSF